MLKRFVLVFAALFAAQAMATTFDWYNTVYDANQLPDSFTLGQGVKVIQSLGIGTKSESIVDIGDGVWDAGAGQAGHGTYLQSLSGKYNARQSMKSSIEFRMKITNWVVGTPVIQVMIGDASTAGTWKVRGFFFGPDSIIERGPSGVGQGQPVAFDTSSDFVTYKIEYSNATATADLYYRNGANWIYLISSAQGANFSMNHYDLFRFGQDGSYFAGRFQIDYIGWNQTAPISCAEVFAKGFGSPLDINKDCYVNLQDYAELAAKWLFCNDPNNEDCLQY